MAGAPVISIFRATGGPVARGVLAQSPKGDKAGLFSPWPNPLTNKGAAFAVYVPASTDSEAAWLKPKEVWIGVDDKNRTVGVVSFTSYPSREGGAVSITEDEFKKIKPKPNGSLWDGLKAARANDFKTLVTLNSSRVTSNDSVPNGNSRRTTAKPQVFERRGVADRQFSDFFCRYLLRWD